jgi:SAM-dependent methyltransferase
MKNPAPLALAHLSFDNMQESKDYWATHDGALNWLWHETFGDRRTGVSFEGICDLCAKLTEFSGSSSRTENGARFGYSITWRQALHCGCGMSQMDRTILRLFFHLGDSKEDHIYAVGQTSALYGRLKELVQNVTASQYISGMAPGEITAEGMRHEDLTGLSFPDNNFDWLTCSEVLEHIPDYKAALREMARVLRPGGHALLTFPLNLGCYEILTRARLLPDGTVEHLLPAEYHGDPANKNGILSYYVFGWQILDEMRSSGFSGASFDFLFGPVHGYMTLVDATIIGIK